MNSDHFDITMRGDADEKTRLTIWRELLELAERHREHITVFGLLNMQTHETVSIRVPTDREVEYAEKLAQHDEERRKHDPAYRIAK